MDGAGAEGPRGRGTVLDFHLRWWEPLEGCFSLQTHDRLWSAFSKDHTDMFILCDCISTKYETGKLTCMVRRGWKPGES